MAEGPSHHWTASALRQGLVKLLLEYDAAALAAEMDLGECTGTVGECEAVRTNKSVISVEKRYCSFDVFFRLALVLLPIGQLPFTRLACKYTHREIMCSTLAQLSVLNLMGTVRTPSQTPFEALPVNSSRFKAPPVLLADGRGRLVVDGVPPRSFRRTGVGTHRKIWPAPVGTTTCCPCSRSSKSEKRGSRRVRRWQDRTCGN